MNLPPIPADAPFLFDFQDRPFAGDIHMEGEFLKLRDQFGLVAAVETGTCYGSTSLWLAQHFKYVCTFENHPATLDIARKRLDGSSVDLYGVDSAVGMREIAADVRRRRDWGEPTFSFGPQTYDQALFFLDAHFEAHCPLLQELAAIAEAGIKPVIVIHDFQVPGRPDLGFDTWEGQPFRFSWIRPSLDAIYGANGYGHYFNSEATGARRGVIYIHPLP